MKRKKKIKYTLIVLNNIGYKNDISMLRIVSHLSYSIKIFFYLFNKSKKYDLIISDLRWEKENITQEIQDSIKNNYNSYLETNGKIILPLLEKEL